MIITDKSETPQKINKIIKAEILYLLKNYFEITADDLDLNIDVNENGKYSIQINAVSSFLKIVHLINK